MTAIIAGLRIVVIWRCCGVRRNQVLIAILVVIPSGIVRIVTIVAVVIIAIVVLISVVVVIRRRVVGRVDNW